jgi:hypothetical protein
VSATSAQLPPQIVPTSNPLDGGESRYVQTVELIRNVAGAGSYSQLTAPFRIWHPSVRLHACATIGFYGDNGQDPTIPAGFTLTMDAWAKMDREHGGRPFRGNQIIPGPFALPNTLPLSYEAVTGVDEWRGVVTCPAGGTTLEVTGYFFLSVVWEPLPNATMDGPTLAKIFTSCKVSSPAGITVFGG